MTDRPHISAYLNTNVSACDAPVYTAVARPVPPVYSQQKSLLAPAHSQQQFSTPATNYQESHQPPVVVTYPPEAWQACSMPFELKLPARDSMPERPPPLQGHGEGNDAAAAAGGDVDDDVDGVDGRGEISATRQQRSNLTYGVITSLKKDIRAVFASHGRNLGSFEEVLKLACIRNGVLAALSNEYWEVVQMGRKKEFLQ